MKRLILIAALFVVGCDGSPEEVTKVGDDFQVGRLFTVDGCSVYRFSDGGSNVYFSSCNGQTQYKQTTSCGKGCTSTKTQAVATNRIDDN